MQTTDAKTASGPVLADGITTAYRSSLEDPTDRRVETLAELRDVMGREAVFIGKLYRDRVRSLGNTLYARLAGLVDGSRRAPGGRERVS